MPLLSEATKVYGGSVPAQKAYLGNTLVWSSSWSPKNIPGLLVWLDATQVAGTDGVQVPVWADLSGTGLNAVSTNANAIYHADGINGHPAIFFGEQGFAEMRIDHGRTIENRTVFVVIRSMGPSIGSYHTIQLQELPPYVQTYATGGVIHSYADPDLNSGQSLTGLCQFVTVWSDSSIPRHSLEVDGHRVDAPTWNPPYASNSKIFIGGFTPGGYAMNGYIGEYLIYERCLSDAERQIVQDYLSDKWSVTTWSPLDIPGLVTWMDPAQDMYGDGEKIATYTEHSANHVVLSADPRPEYQPIFRAGAKPYIEFPNPSFGLASAASAVNVGLDGLTFICVNKMYAGASYPMMIVHGVDANGFEMRHDGNSMQIVEMYTSYGIYFSHGTPDTAGVNNLHVLRLDAGVGNDMWVNNVRVSNAWTPSVMPNVADYMFIGRRQGGYYYYGTISEALVYAGPVSDADLLLLKEYLTTKHGLVGGY